MSSSNAKYSIYLLILSQIMPAFFTYIYDLIPFAFFCLIFALRGMNREWLIPYFALLSGWCTLYFLSSLNIHFENLRWFLVSGRFFIFGVLIKFLIDQVENKDFPEFYIVAQALVVVPSTAFVLYGWLNPSWYLSVIHFWLDQAYPVPSLSAYFQRPVSVNHAAALNDRFVGFFIQPVSGGVFFTFLFVANLYWIVFIKSSVSLIFLTICVVICGVMGNSATFYSAVPFAIFVIFSVKFWKTGIYLGAFGMLFASVIIFTDLGVNFFHFLTSGRFGTGSNSERFFNHISSIYSVKYLLFGLNPSEINFLGKGVYDSGFVSRFFLNGVLAAFCYYLIVVHRIIKLSWTPLTRGFQAFFISLSFLVELGANGFSLPQTTILVFVFYFSLLKKAHNVNG